jgi:hypothetical protein
MSDEHIGQGGSTITQQLVKNTYLSAERTYQRKFAEAMLAFSLERRLSKEDIFALYCNEVYLGQRGAVTVRGVEQAARIYFGKDVKDLTLAEAATLAGMIQGPTRYAPERHPEVAQARRNTVLGTMVRDGWLTVDQAVVAAKEPVTVAPLGDKVRALAPWFIDYVNRVAESQPASDAQDHGRVYTTIDLDLQRLAEDALQQQLTRLDQVYKNRQTAAGRTGRSRSKNRQHPGDGGWAQLRGITIESRDRCAAPTRIHFQAVCVCRGPGKRDVARTDVCRRSPGISLCRKQSLSTHEFRGRIFDAPGHDAHGPGQVIECRHGRCRHANRFGTYSESGGAVRFTQAGTVSVTGAGGY